jgi:hypothetical protein
MNESSQVRNSTLLYRPSFSIWTARIKDKAESVKVASDNGANPGVANVYKALLPESPELKAIQQYATEFRQWIYDNTSPWDDSGWRIGRVAFHMEFMSEVGDRTVKFNELVDAFIAKYATARESARFTLASLFNEGDYPGVNEVRSKFGISLDCMTLPSADDFRIADGLPQEEVDRLVSVAQADANERMSTAMQEAYARLYQVIEKMANTLKDYGDKRIKKFNDTLVSNIADVIAVMPALNILADPKLDALAEEAKVLASYDAGDLRKDEVSRKAAIMDAMALAKKFAIATTVKPGKAAPVAPSAAAVPQPAANSVADALMDMMGDES